MNAQERAVPAVAMPTSGTSNLPLGKRLSVVMPAFNEAERIERNLFITTETLSQFGYDFELILVDDGSTDDTASRALKASAQRPETIRVISCAANRGKGNALMCGTLHAKATLSPSWMRTWTSTRRSYPHYCRY